MIHEHDCGMCDPGSRHIHRQDGDYHRVGGLLVRIGSITERRQLESIQKQFQQDITRP